MSTGVCQCYACGQVYDDENDCRCPITPPKLEATQLKWTKDYQELEAENRLLKAALEKIVEADQMGYGTKSYPDIAREALALKDEK